MKLRTSYTLLNLWRRGQYTQAIEYYLRLRQITSQAIEEGTMYDQYATEWVDLYKKLPEEWGGDELISPQSQVKIEVSYNDMADLVAVLDILDEKVLWENKTGDSKDSADYATDFQIPIYFVACELKGIPVDYAIINHYNQMLPISNSNPDRTKIWNTEKERERGKNFLNTLIPEIYQYFIDNAIPLDNKSNIGYNSK